MKYIFYLPIVHFVHRTETGNIGPTATPSRGDAVLHSVYQAWFTGQTRPVVGESLPIFMDESEPDHPWMDLTVEHIAHVPAINHSKPASRARRNIRNLVAVLESRYIGVPYPMGDESAISQPAGYRAVSSDKRTAVVLSALEGAGFVLASFLQNNAHNWRIPLPTQPIAK